ncbi:hypothetical protein BIZ83_gp142 [Erwinia phage vB_EamM_ChrisDB]|uniref:hypothetical protein n=1 Tax=Erwinia phage vB_EamM_ChrisDB TaxID=1883371 RepID=UPI00081C6DF6|nr:hypothetical protein BIZ83_gp142 [Erwinia phage vB_EamM_ChrisDB]ANZ48711.1 hypothetical protein CHRISDB_149 [Erwinia phage vB_EamM_ChrisDB]
MGLLRWIKRNELRRIKYLEKELEAKKKEAFDAWVVNNQNGNRLFNIMAHLNVSMQGGRDWATVFNETIAQFSEDEQTGVRQAVLETMHRFQLEGKNLNMIQDPVFEFPEPHRVVFPNGTEVMGLSDRPADNDWWKTHSGR